MNEGLVQTVLCPVDFTSLSRTSLQLAIEMCRRMGARLVLEHNLDSRPPSYLTVGWMWSEEHESKERDKSDVAAERMRALFEEIPDDIEHEAKITRGPVDKSLLYMAERLPGALMVMGTHGPSNAKHRSVTERIIIQAPCPVLTTGESYDAEGHSRLAATASPEELSIVVPFDFTERSRACLRYAAELAQRIPVNMELLHTVPSRVNVQGEPEGRFELDEAKARLSELVPANLRDRMTAHVMPGEPAEAILRHVRSSDALFVLMAAHGKGTFKRFLFGTTTLEVLHGCDCPVWFVPPAVCQNAAWTAT